MSDPKHYDHNSPAAEANAVAASRVSGDSAVRDLLLYEFGTTDPDFLKEAFGRQRHAVRDRVRLRSLLKLMVENYYHPGTEVFRSALAAAIEELSR